MTRLVALLVLTLASPVAAAPTVYLCAFESAQGGGWISSAIQIAHDPASGRAEVLDPFIMEHEGGPVIARARDDGAGAVTYNWFLTNFRNGANQMATRLSYRVTIRLADGAATGRMRPAGYRGTFSAPGRCRRQG